MVLKQTDNKNVTDKFLQAGLKAERQMGHYLERAFSKTKDIFVLNDIRIKNGKEVAQIDHLVIHQYGFIVIESKSVSSKIRINEHGEWSRIFNNKESGMPSPIQQGKRQIQFLREYLNLHANQLFNDNFINRVSKPNFDNYKYDILIAISDTGIIERRDIKLNEVFKADKITDKILEIIKQRKNDLIKSLFNPLAKVSYSFHIDTEQKIARFLVFKHKPSHIQEKSLSKSIPNTIKSYQCDKCKSTNLEIRWGRNYYFKCLKCGSNIPIKQTCRTPRCRPKTKKRGLNFYKICEHCGIDELFYTNPSQV